MTPPALQLSGIRKRIGSGVALADSDELIEIADRVVVVFEGRVREVAPDRDVVGPAMPGAA